MKRRNVYSRKISSEESREGYILVLKDRLSFFPTLGTIFKIVENNIPKDARMESYSCTCRGSNLPHEHYFIRWNGLKAKATVQIRKDPIESDRYLMKILN